MPVASFVKDFLFLNCSVSLSKTSTQDLLGLSAPYISFCCRFLRLWRRIIAGAFERLFVLLVVLEAELHCRCGGKVHE